MTMSAATTDLVTSTPSGGPLSVHDGDGTAASFSGVLAAFLR